MAASITRWRSAGSSFAPSSAARVIESDASCGFGCGVCDWEDPEGRDCMAWFDGEPGSLASRGTELLAPGCGPAANFFSSESLAGCGVRGPNAEERAPYGCCGWAAQAPSARYVPP